MVQADKATDFEITNFALISMQLIIVPTKELLQNSKQKEIGPNVGIFFSLLLLFLGFFGGGTGEKNQ